MKKVLALGLAAIMIFSLAACGGATGAAQTEAATQAAAAETKAAETKAAATEAAKPAETEAAAAAESDIEDVTFIIGADQEPDSLDPSRVGLELVRWTTDPCYGRLITTDASDSVIMPALATEWEYASDTEIVFHMRDDALFHNGKPVKAQDVVACLQNQIDESFGGVSYSNLAPYVESVEATDDYTVDLKLKEPYVPVLSIIAKTAIYDPDCVDQNASAPVGCGPFKFVSWDKNRNLKYEAFEDYYEPGVPKYKYLQYNFYAEYNTCQAAYMAGEVDYLNWMQAVDIPMVESTGDTQVEMADASAFYIQGNMKNEILSTPGVMRAIALALDRQQMVDLVLNGCGCATFFPMNPASDYYPKDLEYEKNIEEAKKLLAEAGYPDGFTISLLAPQTATEGTLAEVTQAQLKEIGINVELNVLEVAAFLEEWKKKDFELAICGHGYQTDVSTLVARWTTTHGSNYGAYSNPKYDEVAAKLLVTPDGDERKALYHEAFQYFADDSAVIYVIGEQRASALRNTWEGVIHRYSYPDFTEVTHK